MAPNRQDSPLFQRGIFGSERTAWIALVVYTTLLYATLTLTNDLYRATFDWLGKSTVSQGIYAIAGLIAVFCSFLCGCACPGLRRPTPP